VRRRPWNPTLEEAREALLAALERRLIDLEDAAEEWCPERPQYRLRYERGRDYGDPGIVHRASDLLGPAACGVRKRLAGGASSPEPFTRSYILDGRRRPCPRCFPELSGGAQLPLFGGAA
jgi:hypothetical protein